MIHQTDKSGGPTRPRLRFLVSGGILAILLAIQIVPVSRSNPPVQNTVTIPAAVQEILRRSCFDCHSHETRWPWYSRVAPVSWLVAGHVNDGRSHLNFSRWPVFDFELQDQFLREIAKEVSAGHMPPKSYLIIHRNARLGPAEKKLLLDWAQGG